MNYTVGFSRQFAAEFVRFPPGQQLLVTGFIATFQSVGMSDFTRYEGKIAPSWSGIPPDHANAQYARQHSLWHYHIGHPDYARNHTKYATSDWLLHFQWANRGPHIDLVDLYSHYTSRGQFYLPPISALCEPPLTDAANADEQKRSA